MKTSNPIALRMVYPTSSPYDNPRSDIILPNNWLRSSFHTASVDSGHPSFAFLDDGPGQERCEGVGFGVVEVKVRHLPDIGSRDDIVTVKRVNPYLRWH